MLRLSAVRRLCPAVPGQVETTAERGGGGEQLWVASSLPVCVCVCLTASRCFALIDSSTLEQTRDETETDAQTHLDSLVELGLSSTVSTVLTQCSADIYQVPVHAHTHTHTPGSCSGVSLCRWPCRRSTPSPPPASLRHVCPAGWWRTCAEQQPRWVLVSVVTSSPW